jgi:DNA-binding MarR family transcriptional regulator
MLDRFGSSSSGKLPSRSSGRRASARFSTTISTAFCLSSFNLQELTSGRLRIGPGTLYTAIKRLVAARLIEECESDTERRRCYRLTRKGRELGSEEAKRLSALVQVARKRGLLPSAS